MKPSAKKSPAAKGAASANGNKKRVAFAALGLLFMFLLGGWYVLVRADPQVALVKDMQRELFSDAAKDLPPEERKQRWETFKVETEKLTPEQRVEIRKEFGQRGMEKMNQSGARYFAMSPEDRLKTLDQEIVMMQTRMKQWQDMKAKWGAGGGPGGAPGGGPGPQGGPGGGPPGGGPGPQGGPGGGPPGGGPGGFIFGGGGPGKGGPDGQQRTPEQADTMSREFMLKTTPQARAGMDQKRLDMAARRAQLNLPPMQGRGR